MLPSKRVIAAVLCAPALAALAGCSSISKPAANGQSRYNQRAPLPATTEQGLHGLVYGATESIARSGLGPTKRDGPVLVASLVNVDDLDRSSTLGRMVAKQVTGKLVRMGYNVREVNLRDTLAIRERTGELVLSRNLRNLTSEADAQAVVAGTYAVGGRTLAVHLNMIRASDGRILSAADFVVPMNEDIRGYLGPGATTQAVTLEKGK